MEGKEEPRYYEYMLRERLQSVVTDGQVTDGDSGGLARSRPRHSWAGGRGLLDNWVFGCQLLGQPADYRPAMLPIFQL